MKAWLRTAAEVIGVLLLAGALIWGVRLKMQLEVLNRALGKRVEAEATRLGAARGELLSRDRLVEELRGENRKLVEALREVDDRVLPNLHASGTGRVEDRISLGPEERRFQVVDTGESGYELRRAQAIGVDVVAIQNVDGTRLGNITLTEYDPIDGHALGTLDVQQTEFHFVRDQPDVRLFHPRAVVGINEHGYPMAGAEILNGERYGGLVSHLNLSVLGGWDTRDSKPFGGLVVAVRPGNLNLSIGPAVWFDGKFKPGAAVTLELTR